MNRGKIRPLRCTGILVFVLFLIMTFLPVMGGIIVAIGGSIAAERIEKYVCAVYDVENVGRYAKYDPVSSSYHMTIQGTDGENIKISCDIEGNIFDKERSKNILDDAQIEEDLAMQNERDQRQFGYLTCCWKFDSPETAIITLHVGIRECTAPFPETEESMREKMAERFTIYYDMLTEKGREGLSQAHISYQHYAEKREDRQDHDEHVYSISLDLKDGGGSIKDQIYLSNITKK